MCDLRFWVWLSFLRLKPSDKMVLLKRFGGPDRIYFLNEKDLKGFPECIRNEVLDKGKRLSVDEILKVIKEKGIEVICFLDKRYPERLKNIYGFPVVLYTRGNIDLLNSDKIVSIVGCRNCSEYGKDVSYRLAYNISKKDVVIVSGMARGIDTYSHLGAIKTNCKTIAVLGSGIDFVYPYENEGIYNNIIKNGGLVVSEYCPGVRPDKTFFPMRNRIISGLSDITIVVEAGARSGSLITADLALEQGRDVFVVPGNLTSYTSIGTNKLIKEGAPILTCSKDIVKALEERK